MDKGGRGVPQPHTGLHNDLMCIQKLSDTSLV